MNVPFLFIGRSCSERIFKKAKEEMLAPDTPVYRYISFASLVGLLLSKRLWLSNVEELEDKWELVPDSAKFNSLINKRSQNMSSEAALKQIIANIKALKKIAFINCWCASRHESNALWNTYCPSSEGVAIQTTFERLQKSVPFPVLEVSYSEYKSNDPRLDAYELVTHKRPEFSYEQEVRIVFIKDLDDPKHPERKTVGTEIDWDPEQHLESIWTHPKAQYWFTMIVTETVRRLAPKIGDRVWYSKMNQSPPF